MDLLLESLKSNYKEFDEEEQVLQEIEDALMQPDDQPEDADPQDDKVELKPIEPEQPAAQQDTTNAPEAPLPTPAPRPAAKPAPTQAPRQAPTAVAKQTTPAAPEAPALPSISSTVKTPPKKVAPPIPAPKPDLGPSDNPVAQDKIYAKLQQYRKAGKVFKSPLNSTALSYMTYNPATRGLNVTFTKNDRTYHYKNVSMAKASALIASNSKGTLFNRSIKPNSKYSEV